MERYVNKDTLIGCGDTFDLNQCEYAYEYGGNHTTFHDYATSDEKWDDDRYYADFKKWWLSLPTDKQIEIYFKIVKY